MEQESAPALGWGFPGGAVACPSGRGFRHRFRAALSPCHTFWVCQSCAQGHCDPLALFYSPTCGVPRLRGVPLWLTDIQLLQGLLSISMECSKLHGTAWAPAVPSDPHFAVSYIFIGSVRLPGVLRHPLLQMLPLPHPGRIAGNHRQPLLWGGCSSAPAGPFSFPPPLQHVTPQNLGYSSQDHASKSAD